MAGEVVDKIDKIGVFMDMWNENEGLEEGRDGLVFIAADGDSERVLQACSLETFDLGAHRSREEICTSLARNYFENVVDDLSEIEIKEPVRLIHY
jgi:hypothetical protein